MFRKILCGERTYFYFLFFLTGMLLLGCGYTEPALNEPYGILHPLGPLRVVIIDGSHTIDITGQYIFRISPGPHTIKLLYGHGDTPVEGSHSSRATMDMEIEEGMRYYLEGKLNYGHLNLLFGVGFEGVKSWQPVLRKKEPIEGYKKAGPAPEKGSKQEPAKADDTQKQTTDKLPPEKPGQP